LDLGAGTLHLSRNGKWALLSRNDAGPNQWSATLIELATGQRTSVPPAMRFGTSMIRTCQGKTVFSLHSEELPEAPL
jgi:hypothetical protein